MNIKIISLWMILLMMTGCSTPAVSGHSSVLSSENRAVSISFDTEHGNTLASNQYAVWVEDPDHHVIRTLYVSDFTGRRRGYERRKDALNHWVKDTDPSSMSDAKIDAISGSTLDNGNHVFTWDLKDDKGNMVPSGTYQIKVEGTLFWASNVVYTGAYDTEHPDQKITVREERSEPDNNTNETMLSNVEMKEIRE